MNEKKKFYGLHEIIERITELEKKFDDFANQIHGNAISDLNHYEANEERIEKLETQISLILSENKDKLGGDSKPPSNWTPEKWIEYQKRIKEGYPEYNIIYNPPKQDCEHRATYDDGRCVRCGEPSEKRLKE